MLVSQGRDMQRSIERGIKTTKRELVMLDEGIKNATDNAVKERLQNEFNRSAVKLKEQEARLSDFCRQTGLKRDRFREQVFATETENGIRNWSKSASQKAVWANKKEQERIYYIQNIKPTLSKVSKSEDTILQNKLDYDIMYKGKSKQGIVPSNVTLTDVHIIAGYGSSVNIRVSKELSNKYGGDYWKWQKKTGICYSEYGKYEIHWYEYAEKQRDVKLKGYKEK